MTLIEALLLFYRSAAYATLEVEKSKLWHQSAAQIYAEYFAKEVPKKTYQHGPGHSKLAPYREQIFTWRKEGLPLQSIVEKLQAHGCKTTAQNIWKYLRQSMLQDFRR